MTNPIEDIIRKHVRESCEETRKIIMDIYEAAVTETKAKAISICKEALDVPEETMWNAAVSYVSKRIEEQL